MASNITPNPFALSWCCKFVVELHPGEVHPIVMTVAEAEERRVRCVREAAEYAFEGDAGMAADVQQIANHLFSVLAAGAMAEAA